MRHPLSHKGTEERWAPQIGFVLAAIRFPGHAGKNLALFQGFSDPKQ